jgi:hypothetical protein
MRHWLLSLCLIPTLAAAADFGRPMPETVAPVAIATAVADGAKYADGEHAFSGRIGQVCQNKGCWMTLTEGDTLVRVMTGHRYFLPKDTTGNAVVIGKLSSKAIDEKTREHYRKESGDAAVTAAEVEWRIDAASIRVE